MPDDFEVWVGLAGGIIVGAAAVLVLPFTLVVAVVVLALTVHTVWHC